MIVSVRMLSGSVFKKFRDRSRHLIQLESPLNALDALHHGLQGVAVTG
jgi:hypothetical protein